VSDRVLVAVGRCRHRASGALRAWHRIAPKGFIPVTTTLAPAAEGVYASRRHYGRFLAHKPREGGCSQRHLATGRGM